MQRGRKAGWSERGEAGGRPKGSTRPHKEHKKFKTFSVNCLPEEYEVLKEKAQASDKTISRFLMDLVK